MKHKRVITNVDLSPEWGHIALTDGSGAASLMNDSYVLKGLTPVFGELNEDQLKIIDEIGEEFIVKGISPAGTDTPITPESPVTKSKENNDMSEELVKEMSEKLEAMTKALAVEKTERKLIPFGFMEADASAVAKALSELGAEDSAAVLKAFGTLKEAATVAEEATAKALETKTDEEGNPIVKALTEEAGEADGGEVTEKTFAQRVIEAGEVHKK